MANARVFVQESGLTITVHFVFMLVRLRWATSSPVVNEMCMPNEPDELRRIVEIDAYIDDVIDNLKPRSPRASEAPRSFAPSTLPPTRRQWTAGLVGGDFLPPQFFDFDRDAQATGV